jgi:uncharacterized protein
MKAITAQDIISKFQLQPHIEGGYFKEDYKSEMIIPKAVTGTGDRAIITTCYYLIPKGERSIFHKLASDEIWNFFCGGPVDFYEIDAKGNLTSNVLGPDINNNHLLKYHIKKNTWFGVLPQKDTDFAFFTAIVFPGFEFDDWEKGDRDFLTNLCPQATDIIKKLT